MADAIQIHIPEPCHESWQNMTPKALGIKNVYQSKVAIQ